MLVDAVRSEGRGTGSPMINDSRISEAKLFATANSTVQSRNFGEALYHHGSHLYRDAEHDRLRNIIPKERINHTQWHSDVVGTSSQIVLHETARRNHVLHSGSAQPEVGGDTLFASQVEAYNRLSPEFKKRLDGLRAVHSAFEQAESSRRRGGVHPVVRRHPVTGGKALPEPGFTRRIVGLKTEDSSNPCSTILRRARTSRFMRGQWSHCSLCNWRLNLAERRHAVRLTPQAEFPKYRNRPK
ncbi:hypothetical protein BD769DRAFT_1389070 [Suillus cothurnatus]|nr:hypothetical protein BD769DRAFT_1389070 [Suillus cothurnatus]